VLEVESWGTTGTTIVEALTDVGVRIPNVPLLWPIPRRGVSRSSSPLTAPAMSFGTPRAVGRG
jgi:hypothetical protein